MKADSITSFVKKNYFIIIVGICALVVLLFLSETFGGNQSENHLDESDNLEIKLERFLSKIKGVGECDVILYYKQELKSTFSSAEESMISGIAVICDGGDDSGIKSMLIDVLTRLFGISGSRIVINAKG